MAKSTKSDNLTIDHREILFIRQNAPKRFASIVSEALEIEGINVSRIKVHQELSTIKDVYNRAIIEKARDILKHVYNLEYSQS